VQELCTKLLIILAANTDKLKGHQEILNLLILKPCSPRII